MNWEAIGVVGDLVGAAGVVATLLYLAKQVRQSTRASRLEAIREASENSAGFSVLLASDAELCELFWTGLRDPDALPAPERRRFITAMNVFLRRELVAYTLYREGLVSDEFWRTRMATISGTLNQPGFRLYLDMTETTLPAEFVAAVRDALAHPVPMPESMEALIRRGDAGPGDGPR